MLRKATGSGSSTTRWDGKDRKKRPALLQDGVVDGLQMAAGATIRSTNLLRPSSSLLSHELRYGGTSQTNEPALRVPEPPSRPFRNDAGDGEGSA